MRASMISAALVAALVGYGSTIALVLAAAQAVGASPAQTASWVAAVCFAKAIGSLTLSSWKRVPVVLAWSTPGAALIAASTGVNINEAVGAFILAGVLIALTGALPPVNRAVSAIPTGIASGMLAGVLLPFCIAVATHAVSDWQLVLPLIAVFLVVRLFNPLFAVLAALATGLFLAFPMAAVPAPTLAFDATPLVFIPPTFSLPVLIGLGLPLYLVTMASQNLPGFAVLRAAGYQPPTQPVLGVTGVVSLGTAFLGAHTSNLAAISAALCTGPDAHPDPAKRWMTGPFYALLWGLIALFGASLVGIYGVLPPALLVTVAGTALLGSTAGALGAALAGDQDRLAAAGTLAVTVSGVTLIGVGSAFWGLVFGLLILGIDRAVKR